MDISVLIDHLEDLLNQSKPLPFTHNVIVDEDKMLDLIDQMRMAIPEEVKKAQQIMAQRDRILAQAQEEVNRTLALAREKSEQLVERDAIVQAAKARADEIIAQAHNDIQGVRQDADQYVLDTLTRLEMEMDRALSQIRNGISVIRKPEQTSYPPRPANDGS